MSVGVGVEPHRGAVGGVVSVVKRHVLTHGVGIDTQLGQQASHYVTELPPFEIVGASQREHHFATLVKFVALGMATKVVMIFQQ